ncbi:hypothetical protein H8K38_16170 [Undibacterium sp. FT79W]|uniref:hypothetical protein n=1 Tax=Undibacterium sp. FT79W TaxID=2762296 RepID=UPI00164B5567|nr:hypothetical protein [Undibacterium sp. FT79W]MBC3879347.1 hypothetical protein [Undibacterium sp. FT79W]
MLYEQIYKEFADVDLTELTEEEVRNRQSDIGKTQAFLKQCLIETAKPKPVMDDVVVVDYINKILSDGFNLLPTKLSANQLMRDVQHVKAYKGLIKTCVQNSPFSERAFKVKGLHKLRNNIENAKTLHELRQTVDDMIPVLEVIRELTAVHEDSGMDFSFLETELLLLENEQLTKLLVERERVISELLPVYNDDSILLPKKVAQTMTQHNCSEVQACKILSVGRTTLLRAKQNSCA